MIDRWYDVDYYNDRFVGCEKILEVLFYVNSDETMCLCHLFRRVTAKSKSRGADLCLC